MTGSVDANPSQTRRLAPGSLGGKLALAERDNAELRAELARLRRNMAQCATHLEMAKQALLDDGELDVAEGGN